MPGMLWPLALAALSCCAPQPEPPLLPAPEAPLSFALPHKSAQPRDPEVKPLDKALTDATDAARAARDAGDKFYGPRTPKPETGIPY